MLLQAGQTFEQQSRHCDIHLRMAPDGSVVQVQDACSILGYTGPRVLEVASTVPDEYEKVHVDAGDIVVLMANTAHRGTPSAGDDSLMLFMYWDRSYSLTADKGWDFAPLQPVKPNQLTIKYLALHELAATMKDIFN